MFANSLVGISEIPKNAETSREGARMHQEMKGDSEREKMRVMYVTNVGRIL